MLWLKNLLFTVLIPGTVGVYVPLWLTPEEVDAPNLLPALPLFVVGFGIYAWCLWDFATFGRGTPAPIDAPKKLVVRGLYRYSRNPMYIGVLTVISAWAVYFESGRLLIYAAAVASLFQLFIMVYEEPHLRDTFGEDYENYCDRVGRWLPRRFH